MRIDNQHSSPRLRTFTSLLLLLLVFLGLWLYLIPTERKVHDPDAQPRSVIARGDFAGDERNTIELFQAVSPSVVFITSVELRRDLFSLNIYEIPQGTGSGYVWDSQGRIVTNYHVIEKATQVKVTLADHTTWEARVVGVAPDLDLAVLQIGASAEQLPPIMIGESHNLLVGQKVFAIGNPFGLDQTLTSGIVSALGREIRAITGRTIRGVIQTDAAINPGNSGGPLLDSAGRLIGMNTAILSPSGGSSGIGFAVPVDEINRVVPELIRHGRVIRPGIGVTVANDGIAARLGISGLLVINVTPGGSAEHAGLRGTKTAGGEIILGDVITAINGKKIFSYEDFLDEMDRHRVGASVKLGILRQARPLEVHVTLKEVSRP